MSRPPVAALIIFDGWGLRPAREANAILAARTPTMDRLFKTQAHTEIDASGEAVGLMPGVMGNSEVGHLTIGAGRVIYQDVMRITKAIETGDLFRNETLLKSIDSAVVNKRTLHLWGLLSDGSVHSHIDHLLALLDLAVRRGLDRIAVHPMLDGRDKPPRSALPFVDRLEAKLKQLGHGRIATVCGRYFGMDRDKRWDRVERAWRAVVLAEGKSASTARAAIEAAYAADQGDEFVEPCIIGSPHPIEDGDQVICFNFRADRARELTAALALENFSGFKRPKFPRVGYVCMTEYDRSFNLPLAFGPEDIQKYSRRRIGSFRSKQSTNRRDREVCSCDLLPQWRSRAALSSRRTNTHSVVQGRDVRSRARHAGEQDRPARRRRDSQWQVWCGRDEFRESGYGRAYRSIWKRPSPRSRYAMRRLVS